MLLNLENNGYTVQPHKHGEFITFTNSDRFSEISVELGTIKNLAKFTACYRFNACWMIPLIAEQHNDIPLETQYFLGYNGKRYIMIYALVDGYTRASIFGKNDKINLLLETGDENMKVSSALCLYVIEGTNPQRMVKLAAEDIADKLKTCNLRNKKVRPNYTDLLGFCTYNAFYDKVTHDKILSVCEQFRKNGIELGYIIVDAGWQSCDGNYVSGFDGDTEKFPNGIKETVEAVKRDYNLKEVLVWHTYNGFWSGVKQGSLPDFDIEMLEFYIPERLYELMKKIECSDTTATAGMNFYPPNIISEKTGFVKTDLFRFYFDFYSYLKKQGVDGTKLDAMCWIECFGQNKGGRVRMMQQLISGLEAASLKIFDGEHICCSSCSNDFIYNSLKSAVTRGSTDYFPDINESHGLHIQTNAHTSFWMGELFITDWDMFQSGNTAGEYHAMSRAISGGPIYCTDELSKQRFDIIRKISTKEGLLGLCTYCAKITTDCLFIDINKNHEPIKVYNYNKYGYVLGAFNCCYKVGDIITVTGKAKLSDVYEIKGNTFYVYSSKRGAMGIFDKDTDIDISLSQFEAEIFTICPVKNGYAIIGLTEKYNPLGFVKKVYYNKGKLKLELLEEGELQLYMENAPKNVSEQYSYSNNILKINSSSKNVLIEL